MQRLCRRHVFSSRRGLNVIDMPRLFARLQLKSKELNLHLQCGLLGAGRRSVLGVRGRKVQDGPWTCQLHRLPGRLELTSAEHSFEQLHLQRGLLGACWRHVHGVRSRNVHDVDGIVRMQPM